MGSSPQQEGPLSERATVRKGLRIYVAAAEKDPTLKVSVTGAARRIGVSRDTVYAHGKQDADVADLIGKVQALKRRRADVSAAARQARANDAAAPVAPPPPAAGGAPTGAERGAPLAGDTDDQLAVRINAAVARVVGVVTPFLGKRRRDRDVLDVVKVAHDLDVMVGQLMGCNAQLGALAQEVRHRRRRRAGLAPEAGPPPQPGGGNETLPLGI